VSSGRAVFALRVIRLDCCLSLRMSDMAEPSMVWLFSRGTERLWLKRILAWVSDSFADVCGLTDTFWWFLSGGTKTGDGVLMIASRSVGILQGRRRIKSRRLFFGPDTVCLLSWGRDTQSRGRIISQKLS
jgi:hypothetical protein